MRTAMAVNLLRTLARLRRHTAVLCAAVLAHTLWMAASATCESVSATHETQAPHATHSQLATHHAHDSVPAPSPTPVTPPHPVACPMAMACAVSAVQVDIPTLQTRTLALQQDVHAATATMPRSVLSAPEPPPPRA